MLTTLVQRARDISFLEHIMDVASQSEKRNGLLPPLRFALFRSSLCGLQREVAASGLRAGSEVSFPTPGWVFAEPGSG